MGTRAAPGPEHRRQTGDAGSVSGPVAAIDVVAADDAACDILREVIQFVGRLRAAEEAEGVWAAVGDCALDSGGRALERFIPCRSAQAFAVAHHRLSQAFELCHAALVAAKGRGWLRAQMAPCSRGTKPRDNPRSPVCQRP